MTDENEGRGAHNHLARKGPESIEPRWPSLLTALATGGLYFTVEESLRVGPAWLPLIVVSVLAVPLFLTHREGRQRLNQFLGYTLLAVLTMVMMLSLGLLISELPKHKIEPSALLRSAAALWVSNILIFAGWYWRLDAGGPGEREEQPGHEKGAFLFPQMTLTAEVEKALGTEFWSPGFVDYLFLAFNTSTAFSPTDVPVLTRWAKCLMMLQATISFTTVALLAARAVNIL